ncbi:hypothetical protein D3C81_1180160 [compost metagenome]
MHQFDQGFLHQFQNGHEGHHYAQLTFLGRKQLDERNKATAFEAFEHFTHTLAGRQRLTTDLVTFKQITTAQHLSHRHQQLFQADFRQ